jgi:ketosteroid isomerase-like protein
MAARASSPEELATQLEDAFIVRDPGGLAELFVEHAVLSPPESGVDVRGSDEIAMFAAAHWAADRRYLAQIRRVVQAGDTAAAVVDWSLTGRHPAADTEERGRGVDVLRRTSDGGWRYLISLQRVCDPPRQSGRR